MDYILMLAQDPAAWVALITLIVMEVVLGIDNLLFISIITNKLPEEQRARARTIGILLAVALRLCLLVSIAFIVQLTTPIFEIFGQPFSWRDLILIAGGLFLVWKATKEIHHRVDPEPTPDVFDRQIVEVTFVGTIVQVLMLDLVFSIDSVITAVGMTPHIPIMVTAILIAVTCMLIAAGPLSRFVGKNPTIVMLALGFLLMIGMTLIAEGMGFLVPKGYIYAAMAFSAGVEALNMMSRNAKKRLREAGSGAPTH
ncbi:MAG: TerC family protein [Pseudomonadota bacterium]